MEIRQLRMFVAVMEHGSLTEAARLLQVTQPAVSSALAKLEAQLGFQLFRREGRGVIPTAQALQMQPEIAQVLAGIDRVAVSAHGISSGSTGTLTIASHPGPAVSWLPKVAAAFQRARPDVRMRFLSRASSEVWDLASSGACDLALAEAPLGDADALIRRYRLPLLAALPPSHPLHAHAVITPRLLDGQRFVATIASPWTWSAVSRALDQAKVRPDIVAQCEFMSTALHLVAENGGICLCDPASAEDARLRGLLTRRFEPTILYELALLGPRRGGLSPLAAAFADAIHAYLMPLMARHRGFAEPALPEASGRD